MSARDPEKKKTQGASKKKKTETARESSSAKGVKSKKSSSARGGKAKKTATPSGKSTPRKTSGKTAPKSAPKKTVSRKKTNKKKDDTAISGSKKKLTAAEAKTTIPAEQDLDPGALERGDTPMSIVGHLDEFRSRIFVSLITILVIALASFIFSEEILMILERPYTATGMKLNVFNVTEGFLLRLKASLIAGLLIGFPVVVYEIWKYIAPAISKKDRKFARLSIIAAGILFFGGIVFTYFLMLPFAIKMLLSFTPASMQNVQNASNYLTFVLLFSLGIAILFELPIVIMILTRIGLITPQFLIRKRKYAIVLIFVVAAIITPPDVLTQLIIGFPIVFLYEISILISKFVFLRKKKKEMSQDA